jgi:AcrR family transcriptional regulator
VARYGKEQKAATRQRIVATAGEKLKRDGIDGSGVAGLMAGAGLTNGAFYAHFDSKDDLVATVVADQLEAQRRALQHDADDSGALERFVRAYLSTDHRDDPASGCPSAALLEEIGRGSAAVRRAYTDGTLALVEDLAARLAPQDPPAGRARALQCMATLVGTLQLARALDEPAMSDAVLEHGVQTVLAQMGSALTAR